jgi:hypothetical protein
MVKLSADSLRPLLVLCIITQFGFLVHGCPPRLRYIVSVTLSRDYLRVIEKARDNVQRRFCVHTVTGLVCRPQFNIRRQS